MTLSLILSLIISLLLFFSDLSASYQSAFVAGAFIVSSFYGGLIAARRGGNRGLVFGLLTGALFLGVSWLLAKFLGAGDGVAAFGWLAKTLYGLAAGAFGGMVGVALSPLSNK